MNDDAEVRDRAQKSRAGCAILMLIALLILYALSPPFVVFGLDFLPDLAQDAIFPVAEVVYYPLNWLYFNVELVEDFYDWYQGLF